MSRNEVRRLCEVVALAMYTTGYCTKVQEVRRHERSIYCGVPRLARLTCVRAARPESVTKEKEKPYSLVTILGEPVLYKNSIINLKTELIQVDIKG